MPVGGEGSRRSAAAVGAALALHLLLAVGLLWSLRGPPDVRAVPVIDLQLTPAARERRPRRPDGPPPPAPRAVAEVPARAPPTIQPPPTPAAPTAAPAAPIAAGALAGALRGRFGCEEPRLERPTAEERQRCAGRFGAVPPPDARHYLGDPAKAAAYAEEVKAAPFLTRMPKQGCRLRASASNDGLPAGRSSSGATAGVTCVIRF